MEIAIMSDSHDNWSNLTEAIDIANSEKCQYLLFAGDLIAPPGLEILDKFNGKVMFVWGNNEGEKVGMTRKMDGSAKLGLAGDVYTGEIDEVKIFMNHYPLIAEMAAKSGEYDLVIHGHTHEYREEHIGKTLLLNPGEIQGYLSGSASFAIFDTHKRSVEKIMI